MWTSFEINPPTTLAYLHTLLYEYSYILLFITFASYIVYQRTFSPLANIPGPFWASLTRWWLVKLHHRTDVNRQIMALHDKYGPIVRIAPDEVSVADLVAIKKIFGPNSGFRKSDFYSVWQGTRKFDLFAGRDEKVHGQHRKLVARAYTMETLKDLEPYVDNMLEVFTRKMDEHKDQKIDMSKWVQLFAFDVISEMTWSTSFGFMEDGKDDGTFSMILAVAFCGSWLGQVPWVYHIHEFLKPYIGNHLSINVRHGGIRDFAIRETANRKERPVEKRDIVGRMLETSAQKPDEFPYNDVISMATSNITAGSDTTAVSTRSIIYHLLKHSEAKNKLIEEIDDFRRRGGLSYPPRYEETMKMKYLQACIYEGLRVHPAIGLNLPRVVPPTGAEIAGHYIPGGNIVGVNAWVVHQNRDVFGEDADQFKPERWLNCDTGDMRKSSLPLTISIS